MLTRWCFLGDAIAQKIATKAVSGTLVITSKPISKLVREWAKYIAQKPFDLLRKQEGPTSSLEKQLFYVYSVQ